MKQINSKKILKTSALVLGAMLMTGALAGTPHKLTVFASTNVWGSVVKAVGGDKIKIISGIKNSNQDPHGYEATAKDKLSISKAKFVLVNGGGYDDWALRLINSVSPKPKILNAVQISGFKSTNKGFNEHVFFSLATVKKVAKAVEYQLSKLDPINSPTFKVNIASFDKKIDQLLAKAKKIGQGKSLTGLYTEPVIGYLMADIGIKNITPNDFVEQSETHAGPSIKVMQKTKNILLAKKSSILILNAQTEDGNSKVLQKAAEVSGTPIVYVYETFKNGIDNYIDFANKALTDFSHALNKK